MLEKINEFLEILTVADYGKAILSTLTVTLLSTVIAYLIGIPLGVILYGTDRGRLFENRPINALLGVVINIFRSIPFIILLILCMPIAKMIVGTKMGDSAFVVYLVIAAAPFTARMVESSLKEVDPGVIEAAQSMGVGNWGIIFRVLLPEAMPSLLGGGAIALTTILGYTPMTYLIGGGGLGNYAITYGIYRFNAKTTYIASILLVLLVQLMQEIVLRLANRADHRLRR